MKPASSIGYLLSHVASTLHRQSDQVLQERLGIGMSQYKILIMLQALPNADQRKLADCLGQTEASISRQVKLLHEKGLLITKVDPNERRRHLTIATVKGQKITEAAQEVLVQYHAPLFATLSTKQQEQLKAMLVTLHDYTCAPGRPMACDHPFDVSDLYNTEGK